MPRLRLTPVESPTENGSLSHPAPRLKHPRLSKGRMVPSLAA